MAVTHSKRNRQNEYTGFMSNDPADVVVAFLNTLEVEEEVDTMSDLDDWQRWVETSLGVAETQTRHRRDRARALRTQLRAAAGGEVDTAQTDPVTVSVDLGPTGPRLASDTAVGTIAAAVVRLSIEGRWNRVKICPADDCRWAFYDSSRNQSRQWCSMSVCGNRAKVRKHRAQVG